MFFDEVNIKAGSEDLVLTKEKAIYWKKENALLLADLHAGKASHFRRNGIPLSSDHFLHDLNGVAQLTQRFGCTKLYILGDLYHSFRNEECEMIDEWLLQQNFETMLVAGNHDIHSIKDSRISTCASLEIRQIVLSHEPILASEKLNICGHLHPGFSIKGSGRQYMQLAAYYLSKQHLILPSFGKLTGKKTYKEFIETSRVFPLTEEGLFEV